MIKVLVIEDEELSAKRLVRLLDSEKNNISIAGQFDTVFKTVTYLNTNKNDIDLIFLDIHLADGNSFEIFNQIELNIPIIFTTAYDNYALEAFKQASVDYLLKPIQQIELEKSLKKFEQIFRKSNTDFQVNYSKLIRDLEINRNNLKRRFLVQVGSKIRSIDINEIDLFYAENKSCFLVTRQQKIYDVNYTLEKLKNELDSEKFFRVNRKVIVKIEAIKEIHHFSKSRYKLELNNPLDFDVFISAERITDFKKWMNS
ncbi:LytTR family DNA-binding domain-containing protein [Croceitalea sp. P059]|uniref:LytR/AlgR family response regulator transcription factor n=1 Tax=Croceitalea sp. P059 TaxID=3075601 RepID=UPI0028868EB0|nr:LytTR family DNA-binding domain-containing protein [Croceitalea sp. P059]MDT0540712.1 LytTR family DNA-binding domain-containing protein [Croceitalea sp. P059]